MFSRTTLLVIAAFSGFGAVGVTGLVVTGALTKAGVVLALSEISGAAAGGVTVGVIIEVLRDILEANKQSIKLIS